MSATTDRLAGRHHAPGAEGTGRKHVPRHRALEPGRHRRRQGLRRAFSRQVLGAGRPVALRPAISILLVTGLSLLAVLGVAGASWGYWTGVHTGQGIAVTGTLTPPGDVVATAAAWHGEVRIAWTPSSTSASDPPAAAYHLTRVDTTSGSLVSACATTAASPTTSTSCTDSDVPDGTYRYVVTAVHRTWTASSLPSNGVTVHADTAAPTVTVTAVSPAPAPSGLYPSAPVVLTLGAQDAGGSGVAAIRYDIDGAEPTVVPGNAATVVVSGEGSHIVTYQSTDHAGNTSATATSTPTIDSLAPAVTVQQAPGQNDPTKDTPITFSVIFTEPVTGFTAADVTLSGVAGAATTSVTGDGAVYEVTVSGMTSDGDVGLTVPSDAAHDAAGHGNTPSTSNGVDPTVTYDTTAPAAPTAPELAPGSDTGSSNSDRITRATALFLGGSAEPDATVTLFSDGAPIATALATDGSYGVTSPPLTEGTHLLTAVATDAAGNTGPASPATPVTVDTTAPAAPSAPDLTSASDSGPSNIDNTTMDNSPTFDGTSDPYVTVSLTAEGNVIASGTAPDGTYTLTTITLADGDHTMMATATDVAGNTSPSSGPATITVDTLTPVVVLNIPTYTASNGQARLTGTAGTAAGDGTSITVVICKVNTFPCTAGNTLDTMIGAVAPASGTWTAVSKDLRTCVLGGVLGLICTGPGTVYLRAAQTDLAGHTGTSATRSATFS